MIDGRGEVVAAMTDTVTGLCFRCGGEVIPAEQSCRYCGMPVLAELFGPAQAPPTATPPPVPPTATPPPVPAADPSLAVGAGAGGPSLALGAPVGGGRPTRRGALIAIAVVGVLLLAGGGAIAVVKLVAPTPASTVRDYFGALGDGDAAKAMSLIDKPDSFDVSGYPLLTGKALADKAHRPGDVKVGKPHKLGAADGVDPALGAQTLPVTYRVNGTTVTQTVAVLKDKTTKKYVLQGAFVEITVSGLAGRPATVNGIDLGSDDIDAAAFPGSYDVVAGGNALFAADAEQVIPQSTGNGGLAAAVSFGPPQLAPDAQTTIESQVRSQLDQCAASTEAQPAGCPFGLTEPGTVTSVQWAITTYPAITVAVADSLFGGPAATITDDGSGVVQWSDTYVDYLGASTNDSGSWGFRVNGSAQLAGNQIQVTLN
jgi:hypothetical protein